MKDIKLYITEKLSDENRTLLKYLMSTNKLTDDDVEKLAKEKKITRDSQEYAKWFVDKNLFKTYLDKHGLGKKSFKGNYDISDTLLKFFLKDEQGKTEILNEIIKNNGVCSLKSFLGKNNNIYNIFNNCNNWENIAQKIANIDYVHAPNGAGIGKYEILIRFILQITENTKIFGSGGDVIINTGNDEIVIEVKGADGRMSGQKIKLNPISNVYKKLYSNIINDIYDEDNTSNIKRIYTFIPQGQTVPINPYNYFQNTGRGGKRGDINQSPTSLQNLINAVFNDKIYKNDDTKENDIIKRFLSNKIDKQNYVGNFFIYLADALMEQYIGTGINIDIEKIANNLYNANKNLEFIKYENDEITINSQELINCVGAIQLYMYSQSKEKNKNFDFNYMAVFDKLGNYCVINEKDLNDSNFILNILNKVYFRPIGKDNARSGGACQINLKNNKNNNEAS